MFAYVNGKYLPAEKAVISIKDRGFRYGDGAFETIAVYQSIPYLWELHLERLKSGLRDLKISFNDTKLSEISQSLIKKNKIHNGFLRIYITRGAASSGYLPLKSSPSVVIEATNTAKSATKNSKLYISSYRKIPARSLPVSNKLANSLNSVLARIEAEENKCSDALILDIDGNICETSAANIFWFSGNILYTPSLQCDILAGTTRETVIKLSPFTVKQDKFTIKNLLNADEIFITNVSFSILPVTEIFHKRTFKSGKNTKLLQKLLQENIKKYVAARKKKMG